MYIRSYNMQALGIAVFPFDVEVQLRGIAYLEGSATAEDLVVLLHVSQEACVDILLQGNFYDDCEVTERAARVGECTHGFRKDLTQ